MGDLGDFYYLILVLLVIEEPECPPKVGLFPIFAACANRAPKMRQCNFKGVPVLTFVQTFRHVIISITFMMHMSQSPSHFRKIFSHDFDSVFWNASQNSHCVDQPLVDWEVDCHIVPLRDMPRPESRLQRVEGDWDAPENYGVHQAFS
mmetsp:Transcript_2908/g.4260  ORF Transcript_2908/g.4260 Transcript_2908/m.4260 type:complete len:148 (+) Transcript_2908:8-451(+)